MNHNYCTLKTKKYAHLDYESYRFIESELKQFKSIPHPGKTKFMKALARDVHTSLSNLYAIVRTGEITLHYPRRPISVEFSADAAWSRRHVQHMANSSKILKAQPFIQAVVIAFQDSTSMDSIDEIIGNLTRYHRTEFREVVTTKTFYTYIHQREVAILPLDCPEMTHRRKRKPLNLVKRQKGTSIELRPHEVETREVFGHWEGDTVRGKKTKGDGAILTLVERTTRFQVVFKLKACTSKAVYMAINKMEQSLGFEAFKQLFQSITLDNGNEFARYAEIARKPGCKHPRTTVFFAHPYAAFERGSNENGNRLLRRKIRKGLSLKSFSAEMIRGVSTMINQKKRKILNYQSASELFRAYCLTLNIDFRLT